MTERERQEALATLGVVMGRQHRSGMAGWDDLEEVCLILAQVLMALRGIDWPCAYCGAGNTTLDVLWDTVRFTLICRACSNQQSYPDHIRDYDPRPPR